MSTRTLLLLSILSCQSVFLRGDQELDNEKIYQTIEQKRILPIIMNLIDTLIGTAYSITQEQDSTVRVRVSSSQELAIEEQEFLAARSRVTHKSLEQLLGRRIQPEHAPRIALCFSGGGYRAMTMTLGFLLGAQDMGLLDATTYMAGLSGSTWAMAPWIASKQDLETYVARLGSKTSAGLQPIISSIDRSKIRKKIMSRLTHGQSLSAVDLYGDLLANVLLADHKEKRLDMTLSESHRHVIDGNYPLPIYTAVTTKVDPYEWIECTPFEIGCPYMKSYIPVDAYGRLFKQGVSSKYAPPLSLGYFMGIFGSAFAVATSDIVRLVGDDLLKDAESLPGFVKSALEGLLKLMVDGDPTDDVRLFPSKMANFGYKVGNHALADTKRLTLVDAGIDFNLPFPPLLRKNRNVDIIIVYDASSNNTDFDSLKGAKNWSIRNKVHFPELDYQGLEECLVRVFKDERDPKAPVIIYFPMKKNPSYDPSFDPEKKSFCKTTNFTYKQEQIDLAAGLACYTLLQHEELIKDVIAEVVEAKEQQIRA